MMLTYQEQKQIESETAPPRSCSLATVSAVYSDGITVTFDGETAPREKHFAYNAAVTFQAGQRVRVEKIAGTYVVAYPIAGGGTG